MQKLLSTLGVCLYLAVTVEASLPPPYPPSTPVTVEMPNQGAVVGRRYEGGWDGFLGIPYADNPRFAPPVALKPWSSAIQADNWGPACPQPLKCADEPHVCPHVINETGCLNLNIFRPSNATPGQGLPVMAFIVGGNFDVETANLLLYDGRHFAVDENVIVVAFNYRLGAIGALRLDADGADGIGGDYGMMDQRFALQWIKDHISVFGGGGEVTIFGQSAGGSSVYLALALPSFQGLFDRVISESNPASIFYKNTSQAQAEGVRIAEALNCTGPDRASCMRSKPWLEIASIQEKFRSKTSPYVDSAYGWGPILGGPIGMTAQPVDMAISNTLPGANIPVMLGVTHDEAEQWVYQPFPKAVSPIEFDALLLLIFRNDSLGVAELYPLPDPNNSTSDNRQTMATIGTHYTFICSNRRIATALSANNKKQANPVAGPFLYHYDHVYSNSSVWGANFSYCADRVCHGAELPILFGTVDQFYTVKQEELDLGRQMRAYWASFARGELDASGSLAPAGLPAWPAFSSGSEGSWMRFETASNGGPLPSPGWTSKYCDFWDTAGYGNF